MKRLLLTFAVIMSAVLTSNAEETTKTYSFEDITKIEVGFLYEVYVTPGNSDKVKVVYDSEYEKHLRVKYKGHESKLELQLNDIPNKFKRGGHQPSIQVYLEMSDIEEIIVMGAGKIFFDGAFKAKDLNIGMSSAAKLSLQNIHGRDMTFSCSGACNADISGCFQKVDADISGAAKCNLSIEADIFNGELSGAAKLAAVMRSFCKLCEIECSGAAKLELKGIGGRLDIEGSGACDIDTHYFEAEISEVELSGASKAKVYANKTLMYNVSRASKMIHYGNAALVNMNVDDNVVKGD